MDARSRQAALDHISPEELDKVRAHQAKTRSTITIDDEWLLLTEFARVFGWAAYKAAKNDEITYEEMVTLVESNRRLDNLDMYRYSLTSFIGSTSAQTKRPVATFKSLVKGFIDKSKADE